MDIPSTLYAVSAQSLRHGPADLNYFLCLPDAFDFAVLLKRGTIRLVVS